MGVSKEYSGITEDSKLFNFCYVTFSLHHMYYFFFGGATKLSRKVYSLSPCLPTRQVTNDDLDMSVFLIPVESFTQKKHKIKKKQHLTTSSTQTPK